MNEATTTLTRAGYDDVTGIGAPNVGNFISKF